MISRKDIQGEGICGTGIPGWYNWTAASAQQRFRQFLDQREMEREATYLITDSDTNCIKLAREHC